MRTELPDPQTSPALFENVLGRRVTAYLIDVVIMGIVVTIVTVFGAVLGFLTFGLAWLSLVVVIPLVIAGYYAATLGSPLRATIGMQAMDLVLTPARGQPLDGWWAVLHALVFWVSVWISWPVSLAFALFTPRQQMVHDMLLGVLMVRRSPMTRHWSGYGRTA